MAASPVQSSSGWISDLKGLQSLVNSNYYTLDNLDNLITSEHLEKVKKGVKQLFFWKRKLGEGLNKTTVMLGLLSQDGLIHPSAADIWNYVGKIFPPETLSGIYHAENSNFIGLTFFLEQNANKFRNEITFIGEHLVLYIEPDNDKLVDFRLLWLPPSFSDMNIKNFLMKYSESVSFEHENTPVTSSFSAPNNIIRGSMKLKPGLQREDIPHIVKLEGYRDRHMLIIIRARAPLCLRCKNIGHIRKYCSFIKCSKCTSLHHKESPCLPHSYSTAINKRKGVTSQWTEEVTDPNDTDNTITELDRGPPANDTSQRVSLDTTVNISCPEPINLSPECDHILPISSSPLHANINIHIAPTTQPTHHQSDQSFNNSSDTDSSLTPQAPVIKRSSYRRNKKRKTSSTENGHLPSTFINISASSLPPSSPLPSPSFIVTSETHHNTFSASSSSTLDIQNSLLPESNGQTVNVSSSTLPLDSSVSQPSHPDCLDDPVSSQSDDVRDSQDESSDSEHELTLVGFPENTSTSEILSFLGEPPPTNVYIDLTSDDIFTGRHLVCYNSLSAAQEALSKDGHWHGTKIISISHNIPLPSSP